MNDRESFERAFVAVSYLLGRRDELLSGLGAEALDSTLALSQNLASASHADRARILANELIPVVAALDARRLE